MIMLGDGYRLKSPAFIAELAAGKPTAAALQNVYRKSLDEVLEDLKTYAGRKKVFVASFDANFQKPVENLDVGPAPPLTVGLILAQLLANTWRGAQALEMVRQLATRHPGDAEVHETLGYLQMHRDRATAIAEFSQAAELGSQSARMYRDLAFLQWSQGGAGRKPAMHALSKSLEIEPSHLDARLTLASLHLEEDDYGNALSHLAQAGTISTARAWWYFRTLAYCQLRLNAPIEARKAAVRAQEFADNEYRKTDTAQLLRHIDALLSNTAAAAGVVPKVLLDPDADDDRPRLRRGTPSLGGQQ